MATLIADQLASDPRVLEARELLTAALRDHQCQLTGIKAADPARAADYAKIIADFSQARAGGLYFPYLGSGLGHGALVELADGSVKYDFISGIGVHYLGHSHPLLLNSGISAALSDTVMQGNLQQNRNSTPVVSLLLQMAKTAGARLEHCFLTTSGAMANENALKLMFQRKPGSTRMLAFEHGFCGRTMALSQITDKPQYRAGLPSTLPVDYIPFFDTSDPKGSIEKAVCALRAHLHRYPGQHAGMCIELILGEGGYWVGDHDFFLALLTELKAHNIAVWFDEIQTFGRTSRPFAFEHFDLAQWADVVTVGKLTQLCATLFTPEFKPQPGLLSQTFTASTSAIVAAQAILKLMIQGDLFGPDGRNMQVHAMITERLEAIAARHPQLLHGPYGLGGMIAFTPLDGSEAHVKMLLKALFDAGVIAFYAGSNPARIRMLPPVTVVTQQDIGLVCDIVESTLVACAGL